MKKIVFSLFFILAVNALFAQDFYSEAQRKKWLEIAEQNKPVLQEKTIVPVRKVKIEKDPIAFQGYKAVDDGIAEQLFTQSFKKQKGIVLDLGDHYTGYLSFGFEELNSASDSPIRVKLTLTEIPSEMALPFDPYNGTISRAWLQDEIFTLEQLPAKVTIPRRLSGRYLKIEILGDSQYSDYKLSELKFVATTSVTKTPEKLSEKSSDLIKKIDEVSQKTLRECMQTVYEDGPKRDHRLWIGDLYLQMLANNYTFEQHQLTKRCLYLIAGLAGKDGFVYTNLFENPTPHPQAGIPILLYEYLLIYNACINDYYQTTGDQATANDLWVVAKRQIEKIPNFLDENGLFSMEKAKQNRLWLLIDWKDDLDRQASIQGLYIFALRETYHLAKSLGKEKEVAHIPALISKMTKAANSLYDKQLGVFVSGEKKQVSYASQAWMILAKVTDKKQSQQLIKNLYKQQNVVKPGGAYLYHYFIQALVDSGLEKEAKAELETYWGGMVQKGADTFWEVYDPTDDFTSPYKFAPINSYCHAWSCTPSYFIRKYPHIFQK